VKAVVLFTLSNAREARVRLQSICFSPWKSKVNFYNEQICSMLCHSRRDSCQAARRRLCQALVASIVRQRAFPRRTSQVLDRCCMSNAVACPLDRSGIGCLPRSRESRKTLMRSRIQGHVNWPQRIFVLSLTISHHDSLPKQSHSQPPRPRPAHLRRQLLRRPSLCIAQTPDILPPTHIRPFHS